MVRLLYFVFALTLTFCISSVQALPTAAAQGQPSSQQRARALFQEGVALAKSERWADALWAFRRSAKLVPRPSTSYNIANALYRLNRPVQGLAELDEYQSMSEVLIDQAARERGETLRSLLESAVAELRLAITPSDAEVFIDGRPIKGTGFERNIRVNPGTHSLRVTHDEHETSTRELRLKRGSREAYTIALRRHTPAAAPAIELAPSSIELDGSEASVLGGPQSAPTQDDRKRFVKRPGFWVMIGAIAAVGVGAGLAVALTRRNDEPPCGTTGTCATTQGLTLTSF